MLDGDFDRLLGICRLELTDDERQRVKSEIEEVIKYFDSLDRIDCSSESEAYQPVPIREKVRGDAVEACQDADLLLKSTKTYRFYVIGPKI